MKGEVMANWRIYKLKENEKRYKVVVTLSVNAISKDEAEKFVESKIDVEGGFRMSVEESY
jgi:hypothetical protein